MDARPGDDDDMFGDAAFPQDLGPPQEFENESSDSEEEFPRELIEQQARTFGEALEDDLQGEADGAAEPQRRELIADNPTSLGQGGPALRPIADGIANLERGHVGDVTRTNRDNSPGPSAQRADSSSMGSFGRMLGGRGKLFAGGRASSPLRDATLDDLSEDLLIKIFAVADLSVKELCQFSTLCRKFKRVCYGSNLWTRITLGREVNNCTLHKIAKRCSSLTELRIEKVQKIHGLRSVFRACGHSLKRLKISWESNSGSGFAFLVLWMVSRDCNKLDSVELTSSARSAYSMGLEYGPIWCLTVGCPAMRTFIDFCGRSTTDNTLNLIGRAWKDLTTLAIHGVMFTMRGLIQLRGCTKLQSLEVCDGKLGLIGEALEPRQPGFMLHDTLERLSFNRTPVTTDEVKLLLRACPALKRVEVKGLSNAITGVGEEAKEEMLAVKKRIADFGALNAMPVFKSRGLVVYAE